MAKKIDAVKEARRAMSALNEADQLYASLPMDIRNAVFQYAYAVERAKCRIQHLLAHSPEGV
ncbi:MAG: hypothetical protein NT086_08970 [Proteobacteria bacterium]|nr:hypothetical protein [Pseudomonadota bacterium]